MLAAIDERLLDIVGGVEFGRLFLGFGRGWLGVVAREGATVLSLDGPKTSLFVHLGTGKSAYPSDQLRIPTFSLRFLLRRRHCCCCSYCCGSAALRKSKGNGNGS